MFKIIAIFISVAAIASYVNYRYIKLPSTVGLMIIGLVMSLALIGLSAIGINIEKPAADFLGKIDFGETLMKGMLSFLLFAGALKINLNDLAEQKYIISILATAGVVVTALVVGTALYFILPLFGLSMTYPYCLVFGALISPTDPVAVLAILKTAGAPKSLETKIAGESLFNDGVGVVVFSVLLGVAAGGGDSTVGHIIGIFLQEAIGGIIFGIIIGLITYWLLKDIDDHSVEILLTLALVSGGYVLASLIHTSGPIAIVVAGLLIGNYGRRFAMSETTRGHLDRFWELIDEFLNTVLFVWMGLEILILTFTLDYFLVGLIAIPLTLLARLLSVSSAINLMKFRRQFSRGAVKILTWGGLRGGICIALALSLPASEARALIISITYVVVVFSILVQGLTIETVIKKG